jgi:hypothetical protein
MNDTWPKQSKFSAKGISMKLQFGFYLALLPALLLAGCGIVLPASDAKGIVPSDTIISKVYEVSSFTGINMSVIGTITITQGEVDSLTVTGSDNLVPLVKIHVQGDVLFIDMENVNVLSMDKENVLNFEITVKDLDNLTVSGFGTAEIAELDTKSLDLVMSGMGAIRVDNLTADSVAVHISGQGGITLAGTSRNIQIEISGAGEVMAADLQCQTADTDLSGVGTATLWVTEKLMGTISGAGSVRYYGEPKTTINSTGAGQFESLGSK